MIMTELGMNKQGLSATLPEAGLDKSDAVGMSHQASGSSVILLWLQVMKICAIFFYLPKAAFAVPSTFAVGRPQFSHHACISVICP